MGFLFYFEIFPSSCVRQPALCPSCLMVSTCSLVPQVCFKSLFLSGAFRLIVSPHRCLLSLFFPVNSGPSSLLCFSSLNKRSFISTSFHQSCISFCLFFFRNCWREQMKKYPKTTKSDQITLIYEKWVCKYCSVCGRQVRGEMEKERGRVAVPSGRLFLLSICCLRAGSSTAAPVSSCSHTGPPCMQNRLRLPSLLGHALSTSTATFPLGNKHLFILLHTPPPSPHGPQSAFNSISSCQMCSVMVATRTKAATRATENNFRRRSTSRAACDNEKK